MHPRVATASDGGLILDRADGKGAFIAGATQGMGAVDALLFSRGRCPTAATPGNGSDF